MQDYSFHDSTLSKFNKVNNDIILEVEDIYSTHGKIQAKIICYDVISSRMDDKDCIVSMFYPDSEILDLEILENSLKLVIIWYDFINKQQCTKCYKIKCKKIETVFM